MSPLKYKLRGKWFRIYIVIMSFVVFDCILTSSFCTAIDQEGGYFPHLFMMLTGSIFYGLSLNFLFMAIIWYIGFYYMQIIDNYLLKKNASLARTIERFGFVLMAIFPARSIHGATSWFLFVPGLLRMVYGIILYFISLVWVDPFGQILKELETG